MESIRKKNRMIETYCILLLDVFSAILAYALSLFIRANLDRQVLNQEYNVAIGAYIVILCLMYTLFVDGNRNFFARGYGQEFYYTVRYTFLVMVGLVLILFLAKQVYVFSRIVYILFAVFNTLFAYVAHLVFKNYMLKHYRKSVGGTKMLALTNEYIASEVVGRLINAQTYEFDVTSVAIFDADKRGTEIEGVPVVASKEDLYEKVIQLMVDEVFICLPGVPVIEIRDMIEKFEEMGLVCHYNVDLFSHNTSKTSVQKIAGYSVLSYQIAEMDSRRLLIKRIVDIVGALVGIILTCIITPFVALAIKIESPGPVFFSQTRIGKNGRRFKIWKFRSMYIDAEERKKELMSQNEVKGLMFKMDDDPRITKVGKFIRKTSIDETPQFFNILAGDMSLVGTRPPTVDEFEQYNGYYRRRLSITPGLTGMWQANGRSEITDFDEIVKLDLEYIDNWSLGLDIKILFQTVFAVLGHKGSK